MSWIVNDSANISNLVPIIKKNKTLNTSDGQGKTDTQSTTNTQATESQDKTVQLVGQDILVVNRANINTQ